MGSFDVNGNNRYLFTDCKYIGIDVAKGSGVDVVSLCHEYNPSFQFDTIISTECFEHDKYFTESIINICRLLKSRGLFLFTAAGYGRSEHGTRRCDSGASPLTQFADKCDPDYYHNITVKDICFSLDLEKIFCEFEINYSAREISEDIRFYGIKR